MRLRDWHLSLLRIENCARDSEVDAWIYKLESKEMNVPRRLVNRVNRVYRSSLVEGLLIQLKQDQIQEDQTAPQGIHFINQL